MIFELVLEDEEIDGIFAISLVSKPAIESDFVYFDKEEVKFAAIDNEKRLVMGPILVPDKKIIRIDGEGKPYHVFFKASTIKRLSEKYLEDKNTSNVTLEHNAKVKGVSLVESWIKESQTKDKSALYNLNVPVGSWLGTFKIDNDEIWNDYVKTGKVAGFSIEGLFGHNLVAAAKEEMWMSKEVEELTEEEANIFLSMIKEILLEAQPSVASSYPGEVASGSIAPALLAAPEIDIFGYGTKQFYICPGAIGTFEELKPLAKDEDTIGMIRSAAQIADNVFKIEKDAIENKKTTQREVDEATVLVADFKDLIKEIEKEVGKTFDVSYMDGHIVTIKSFL